MGRALMGSPQAGHFTGASESCATTGDLQRGQPPGISGRCSGKRRWQFGQVTATGSYSAGSGDIPTSILSAA